MPSLETKAFWGILAGAKLAVAPIPYLQDLGAFYRESVGAGGRVWSTSDQ